jgi:hypothetical protein
VFEDVEARRILEQPAREDPVPFEVGIDVAPLLHHDLDESAGLGRFFPRLSAFAGRHADYHVADPALLAGLQLDFPRDVVALVEQSEDGDPLVHRSADAAACDDDGRVASQFFGDLGFLSLGLGRLVGARDEESEEGRDRERSHASGVQAS